MKKIKLLVSVILLTAISAFANSQDYDWIQMTQYVSYATNGTTETQRQEFEYDNDGKEIGFKLYLNGTLYSQYRNYQYNGRTATCWMDTYTGSIIQSTCKLQRTYKEVTNSTEIVNVLANSISIYPSPTKGELIIENGDFKIGNIDIYDNSGKKVLSSTNTTINISQFLAGTYFVKIKTDKGEFTKKIFKE